MSFFPFDNDDEEDEQEFDGDIEELVKTYEARDKDAFSATELLFIFRFYSLHEFDTEKPEDSKKMKHVLVEGISQFPHMAVFAIHMAEVCIGEENYRMARKYIQEALAYNPMDTMLMLFQAILLAIQGKENKADELLETILANTVNDNESLEEMLEVCMFHHQIGLARPIFDQCLEKGVKVEHILETFYQLNGDSEDLEAFLPMAIAVVDKDPYSAEAWYMLGNIYVELKNTEKSEWAFDYACTINDKFFEARVGFLESMYENEKYSSFIPAYHDAEKQFGANMLGTVKGLLAWSLYEIGEVKESRATYHQVLKKYPNDKESWYSLGLTYHYDKKYQQAIPFLLNAYNLGSDEPDYGIVLASAYFGTQEYPKALEIYDKLSSEYPENPEVWLDWSTCVYETGTPDEALMILEAGLKHTPYSVSLMYRFAALLYLTRQRKTALFVMASALQINPQEHTQMFTFAPELKKSLPILKLIAQYTNPEI
jgi:tetratricopeptide (TPR) repeat protein